MTKAVIAPSDAAVLYNPTANPRSSAVNHSVTNLGAPIDMNGPPSPNTATANHKPVPDWAPARSNAEALIKTAPEAKQICSP